MPYCTMALSDQLAQDLKEAMKAKDQTTLTALRAVKAALLMARTAEGAGGQVSEAEELKMLQKLVKQRRDAETIYLQQGRADLAGQESAEIAVIERYLPAQMDASALREALKVIVDQLGASGPGDMGKVMGAATKALAGKAEGKAISEAVRELLG
jgi:uncharacterized protein